MELNTVVLITFDWILALDLRPLVDTSSRDKIYMAFSMELHQSALSAGQICGTHKLGYITSQYVCLLGMIRLYTVNLFDRPGIT
jgi:hypothetical protein